jgi:hypothetical protein
MNFRTHTLLAALGRIVRFLTLALLPALVAEGAEAVFAHRGPGDANLSSDRGNQPTTPRSTPYLALVGPPPLRFREPPAPPPFELEPIAAGPAQMDELNAPLPSTPARERAEPTAASTPSVKPAAASPEQKRNPDGDPAPILPDDSHRDVRPEDLLPFFLFPRNGRPGVSGAVPLPPQPGALPPSSATYRQQ